jgi:branched-chain amino acid transport system permease protein
MTTAVVRASTSIEARAAVRWGAIAGTVMVFIGAIGMVETFDVRKVVDPFLSLGYLALFWAPLLFGYRATYVPVLEGMEAPKTGAHNVGAGALSGAVAGSMVAAFLVLADVINLREVLLNVTPALVDLLSFGQSVPLGALLLIAVSAAIGAAGGAFHLLSDRWRTAVVSSGVWVLIIGFLELVLGNVLEEIGLGFLDDLVYSSSRGVSAAAAAVIVAVTLVLNIRFAGRASALRESFESLPEGRRRTTGFAIATGLIAIGLVLPSFFGPFLNEVLATVGLFMLMGLGLNVVVGFAGLLDLGYVAFFAVGAYTTAVFTSPLTPAEFTPAVAFWEALPFVIVMAAIAGIIVGTPVIRMRGDYLAIVTLAFGEIARLILQADWLKGVFGGAQGILRIGEGQIVTLFGYVLVAVGVVVGVLGILKWRVAIADEDASGAKRNVFWIALGVVAVVVGLVFPDFSSWTVTGIDSEAVFRLVLVFAVIAAFVSWRLQDSRIGRAWMAMREDEQVAEVMGINVVTAKLLAFIIGAILASLGGAIFAVKIGSIFPSSFQIVQSIIILVIVIVGGMGSLRGVAVGALVLIGVLGGPTQPGMLREFQEYKLLIYGVLLVYMMLQRPEGLVPNVRRSRELHVDELTQDAWYDKGGNLIEAEED